MKIGAILKDYSKALGTLNNRFLLAKIKAYGLQPTALKICETIKSQ